MTDKAKPLAFQRNAGENMGKLIVTSKELHTVRKTIIALRRFMSDARIWRTKFRGIIALEAQGDAQELASRVIRDCHRFIGHVTAVLPEVESAPDAVKEAAIRIGAAQIGQDESFAFRINKRGSHRLEESTPDLERDIGGAIWNVLHEKYGKEPNVNLRTPDVAVIAEVLGTTTAIGVARRIWAKGVDNGRRDGGNGVM
jgi:tRNA(Ser,Leu) C12 N-acetylase TAN1